MITITTRRGIEALDEYDSIICNRRNTPLPKGEYGEVHHIQPRCCGGGNNSDNLVKLTPEEHYRCHELLPFIFETGPEHYKLVLAWNRMLGNDGVKIDAGHYGNLKRELVEINRQLFKGKHHTEEYKHKMSVSQKGRKFSEETRRKMSESAKKKFEDPEFVKKRREATKKQWSDPEFRKRMSESRKGNPAYRHSEEWRKQHSECLKRLYAERRAKLQDTNRVLEGK